MCCVGLRILLAPVCIVLFVYAVCYPILLCFPADNVEVAALVVLPALLPDARYKVDVGKVISVAKVRDALLYEWQSIIVCWYYL